MATHEASTFRAPAHRNAECPLNPRRLAITVVTAVAFATADTLRVLKIPKGAVMDVLNCYVWAKGDPNSANNLTLAAVLTDGATSKTLIAAAAFQADNAFLRGTSTELVAMDWFKTTNTSFRVELVPGAGVLDAGAVLRLSLPYFTDGDVGDVD